MNRALFLSLALLATLLGHSQPCVVSKSDGHRVVYAHVYDQQGRLLGMTDTKGMLPAECVGAGKVWIGQPAFQPVEMEVGEQSKVELSPIAIPVLDTTTPPEGKDYLWMRTYWRSYVVGDEGIAAIDDGVTDCYYPLNSNKVKESEVWLRYRKMSPLPAGEKKLGFMTVANGAAGAISPYESFKKMTDEERQRFFERGIACMNDNPKAGILQLQTDGIKLLYDHTIPLMFTGMRILDMKICDTFASQQEFARSSMLSKQTSMCVRYKNKETNEKKQARVVCEVYYLDRGYLSKEERKAKMKTAEAEVAAYVVPAGVPELPRPLQKPIESFEVKTY